MPAIKSTHSLVAKYVTGPIWEKLSQVKTKVSSCVSSSVAEPEPVEPKIIGDLEPKINLK